MGERIRNSRSGTRYYQDLIRERYFLRLTRALSSQPGFLREIEAAYDRGDYGESSRLLKSRFSSIVNGGKDWYENFQRRFRVRLSNTDSQWRMNEPVILRTTAIHKSAPDFNARNFVVVASSRGVCDREIVSQADDLDNDGNVDEIVFSADLRPRETADYWIYYSPHGERRTHYTASTGAGVRHDSRNHAGLESRRMAYEFVDGRVEFWGKKNDTLILEKDQTPNAGREESWGARALDAEGTPGLGGLTIWDGKRSYHALSANQEHGVKISRSVVAQGPVRAIVSANFEGITFNHHQYDVRQRSSIYANQRYIENHVWIQAAKRLPLRLLSPAFTRLLNDRMFFNAAEGYFGSWGRQNSTIQEIGLAAIFPTHEGMLRETANQRQLLLNLSSDSSLAYYTVGDWRRARIFPVAPTVENWQNEIRALARRLHTPVETEIGISEMH